MSDCHPEKPEYTRGLCKTCYGKWLRDQPPGPNTPRAECHPDRRHYGKGFCYPCYMRDYAPIHRRKYPEREREHMARKMEAKPELYRDIRRRAQRKYAEKVGPGRLRANPEGYMARRLVRKLVAQGVLVKKPCHCGNPLSQAHHYLGYDREHWLDIEWLCSQHHAGAHRSTR